MSRLRNIPQKGTVTEEQGFSLVELLVVLSLIGLVAGFVSTVYLFGQEAFNRWEKNMKLENELHTVLNGIAEDLYRAKTLREIGEQSLDLMVTNQGKRVYKIEDETLIRNRRSLLKEGIYLTHFNVSFEPTDEGNNILTGLSKIDIEDIHSVGVELRLTDRIDTLSSKRIVHLRKPAVWKALKGGT